MFDLNSGMVIVMVTRMEENKNGEVIMLIGWTFRISNSISIFIFG